MTDPDRTTVLLEEIRDLQRALLDEYREQAARSIRVAEESVARQRAIAALYQRVVLVSALLVVVLLAFLWWRFA